MRVLVCGGRDFTNYEAVQLELDLIARRASMLRVVLVVIHGAARGADSLASRWCKENPSNVREIAVPAEWDLYGKRAGPIRNQAMINDHRPHFVLAFPGGAGTADMIRRAEGAGIEVRRWIA